MDFGILTLLHVYKKTNGPLAPWYKNRMHHAHVLVKAIRKF
jgi:hypothetical protein